VGGEQRGFPQRKVAPPFYIITSKYGDFMDNKGQKKLAIRNALGFLLIFGIGLFLILRERSIESYVRDLRHIDTNYRTNALKELKKRGWKPANQEEQIAYSIAILDWQALVNIGKPAVESLIVELNFNTIFPSCDSFGAIGTQSEALAAIGDFRATKPLINIMQNKDNPQQKRYLAIEALGKLGDKYATKFLISTLDDENQSIKASVVKALGELGDLQASKHLLPLLKDNVTYIRDCAFRSIVNLKDFRTVEPLIELLKESDNKDTYIRENIIKTLGELGDKRATEPLIDELKRTTYSGIIIFLIEALDKIDPDWRNSKNAKKAIKNLIGSIRSTIHSIKALYEADPDWKSRQNAKHATASIIGSITLVHNFWNEKIIIKVIHELHKLDPNWKNTKISQEIITELLAVLKVGDKTDFLNFAIIILGEIGDPRAIELLIPTLKDEKSSVRSSSERAIRSINNTISVRKLKEFPKKHKSSNKEDSLGILENSSLVDILIGDLQDKKSYLRYNSISLLAEIGGSKAMNALITLLKDEKEAHYLRAESVKALAKFKEPLVIALLSSMLKDKDETVRLNAADVLRTIGSPQAVEPLINTLNDRSLNVRESALIALKTITKENFGRNVDRWRAWWEENKEEFGNGK
jgi:HEAT repeat protein